MYRCLSEAEAKLLMESLQHRSNLLTRIASYHTRFKWSLYLMQLAVGLALAFLWRGISGNTWEGLFLFVLFSASAAFMHLLTNHTSRRIDALVHLLRQEGMLGP